MDHLVAVQRDAGDATTVAGAGFHADVTTSTRASRVMTSSSAGRLGRPEARLAPTSPAS